MKFTIITSLTSFLFISMISSVASTPVDIESRDVFVPPVIYPKAGTVWKTGEHHNVVWDTSDHPVNITNKVGRILLRKGGLSTPLILASKFDILLGHITVQVPNVLEGSDYQVVLFGDSGNFSPLFTITGSGFAY